MEEVCDQYFVDIQHKAIKVTIIYDHRGQIQHWSMFKIKDNFVKLWQLLSEQQNKILIVCGISLQ